MMTKHYLSYDYPDFIKRMLGSTFYDVWEKANEDKNQTSLKQNILKTDITYI